MTTRAATPGTPDAKTGGNWWWRVQRSAAPYVFISPFFVFFAVFGLYPILYSLYLSFFKGFGFEERVFFGLGNYAYMLGDPRYIKAVLNTTYYAAGSVFILAPLALLLALAFNSRYLVLKSFFKVAFFFPVITSFVVIAVIFVRVYDTDFGLLNTFLGWFGVGPVGWLTDPNAVMPSLILMGIWTYLGINSLYWLAGLSNISRDLYDAAHVDGASKLETFWYVTLPLLRPVTLFVVIQAIVGSYNLFAQPLLMTNGGPADASLTITLYLYQQGFQYFNVGYASAIAYSMFVLLLLLSLLNIWIFRGYRTSV